MSEGGIMETQVPQAQQGGNGMDAGRTTIGVVFQDGVILASRETWLQMATWCQQRWKEVFK